MYPKEAILVFEEISAPSWSLQHYSQVPKDGNMPSIHKQMNGDTKCSLSIQWNIFLP